jgi:hypothetical protein
VKLGAQGRIAKSIHLNCVRLANGQAINVSHIDGTSNFISGYWFLNDQEAEALIGGWLHLHETKASKSYRGGQISGFKHEIRSDVSNEDRIGLILRPVLEAIGSHGMDWRAG